MTENELSRYCDSHDCNTNCKECPAFALWWNEELGRLNKPEDDDDDDCYEFWD